MLRGAPTMARLRIKSMRSGNAPMSIRSSSQLFLKVNRLLLGVTGFWGLDLWSPQRERQASCTVDPAMSQPQLVTRKNPKASHIITWWIQYTCQDESTLISDTGATALFQAHSSHRSFTQVNSSRRAEFGPLSIDTFFFPPYMKPVHQATQLDLIGSVIANDV